MKLFRLLGKKQRAIIAAVLAAVCALFVILGCLGMKSGGSTVKTPNEAKHGVVWIFTTLVDGYGDYLGAAGTGFMIGEKGKNPEYVVTNAHVVSDFYEVKQGTSEYYSAAQLEIYFSAAENDSVIPQIVYFSPPNEKDIAILKLPKPTTKRVPLAIRDSSSVKPGDEVYAIGYPGISSQLQDYITYDENDATLTRGVISKITNSQLTTDTMFELDAVINHGNSGGPLVDPKGNVIGINESISQETVLGLDDYGNITALPISNDLGYAISSNDLQKILKAEEIPYMTASSGVGAGSIAFLVIGAIAGVLALLVLLSGLGAAPVPARRPAGAPMGGPGANAVQGGPAAGAAAGGAATGAAAGAAYTYGAAKKPSLRGLTGQYAGKSIPIGDGKLTIGRNGQVCNVVFDKDTPGVSGNHCSIVYDRVQDVYMLTDNGSTYGTFLGNDKKLAAGVPERLRDGDMFYLANKNIRFLVTKE